jgi:hypothetical protein
MRLIHREVPADRPSEAVVLVHQAPDMTQHHQPYNQRRVSGQWSEAGPRHAAQMRHRPSEAGSKPEPNG